MLQREEQPCLTAPERETVITFSDESDTATVHTHQRRIITKLRNNPAATQVEDLPFDGTPGAVFELPVWAISFLSKKRKRGAGNVETLARAREKSAPIPRVRTRPRVWGICE